MIYSVQWDTATRKDLRRINKSDQKRIVQKCHDVLSVSKKEEMWLLVR